MKALSVLFPILGMGQLAGSILSSIYRQKRNIFAVTIGAISNLLLNFIFIPQFAAMGAVIGSIIAETIVTVMELYYLRDVFELKKIVNSLFRYLPATLSVFIVMVVFELVGVSAFFVLIGKIIVSMVIYFIVLLVLKDEIIMKLLKQVNK